MADSRGHQAEKPQQIPKEGWKDIGKRVFGQIKKDNIDIVAAGVAFYFFLAIFPTLAATVSIYGLVTDPGQVQSQMSQLTSVMPQEVSQMISERLQGISGESDQALGWSVVIGILLSLWSANKGTKALFTGVNIAYDEEIDRGFIKDNALSLAFTLGGIIIGILSITLVVGFTAIADQLGLPSFLHTIINWLRWPMLLLIVMFSLALVYRFAPDRDNPKFKWVNWGAAIAAFLWMLGSLGFSFYVSNFGSYNETYGSVAAVIILLLWFLLTSYIILLGAEINSEMEHQTAKDTTKGKEKPMGERGAYHADHVAGGEGRSNK